MTGGIPEVPGPGDGPPPGWIPTPPPESWGPGPPPGSWGQGPPPGSWGPGPPPEPDIAPQPSIPERFATAYAAAPITVGIVVFTVAVWLVHLALQRWTGINTDLTLGDNGMGIHGQWWRLVTAMFVHFGVVHIGLNMFMLWRIGPPVEKVMGKRLFFVSYMVCGIAGGVLSDLVLGPNTLSGGASGAIVGIVGLLIGNTAVLHHAEARGRRTTQEWRFNPKVAKSLGIQIVLWIVLSSAFIPQIDNWAHIGGGAIGLVIGGAAAWRRTGPVPETATGA